MAAFDDLPGDVLSNEVFWRELAYFLDNDIAESEKKASTIIEYLRKCTRVACDKFSKEPAFKPFWDQFNDPNDYTAWFKGMIRQLNVSAFQKAVQKNETVAKQAYPISLEQRQSAARAFSLIDTKDSHFRGAVCQVNAAACGRPSEVANFSYDIVVWDAIENIPVAQWVQMKTHKHKLVLLVPGADRLLCPVYSLALAHAAGCFRLQIHQPDDMNYLFTSLANRSKPPATQARPSSLAPRLPATHAPHLPATPLASPPRAHRIPRTDH